MHACRSTLEDPTYEELGVHVATDVERKLSFPEVGLSVLAIPHAVLQGDPIPKHPEGAEPFQVILMHGEVEGLLPGDRSLMEYGGLPIPIEDLRRENWAYCALGHYHVQHEVFPRCWYSGSLEYTSTNIWSELVQEALKGLTGKGWLMVDLETGKTERHAVPTARQIWDAPLLDADGLAPAEIDRAIGERIAQVPGGIQNAIVRLVVENISRAVMRELDHAAIRYARSEALHFHLDCRRPIVSRAVGTGAPGKRQTLPEMVQEFLSRRPLPERLSRERFVSMGLELLNEPDPQSLETG